MKIEQLAIAVPSRKVSNDEVIEEIARQSLGFEGDLPRTLNWVSRMLRSSGANTRHWLAEDETSFDITVQACREAIEALDADDRKIDLIICASVHFELAEPATSNMLAHELGLDHTECFDLREACDGWMKAARIASCLIDSGEYRRIMVVNGEFSVTNSILPKLYKLSRKEELEWRFPAYTVGEAATATIFAADSDSPWRFTNKTRNDLYDLCTVTPPWMGAGPSRSHRIGKDGPATFTSYGAELRAHGFPLIVEHFRECGINSQEVDIAFTHSSSKSDWADFARQVSLSEQIFDIYARYGNLVSAAVPAGMAVALDDGALSRGQRVAAVIASAGMSFSTASFVY